MQVKTRPFEKARKRETSFIREIKTRGRKKEYKRTKHPRRDSRRPQKN